jgi:hypothetical protein
LHEDEARMRLIATVIGAFTLLVLVLPVHP